MPEWRQARLRLGECHAWLESSNDIQPTRTPVIEIVPSRSDLRLHHHWSKNVGRGSKDEALKAGRRYSDDRKRMAIYQDGVVHYSGVRTESSLPISVAEHDDRIAFLRLIIRLDEHPA